MANREKDLRELKKYMNELFKRLKEAKTEDDKLHIMEVISMAAGDMIRVIERSEA